MKTAISPSPSQASLNNNAFVNPFSKSESEGVKRSSVSVSPARSPMSKKGPIVKTVKKKSNDSIEAEQKNEETKDKATKRTSLIKRNETYTKKNLENYVEKEPQKARKVSNDKLSVDNGIVKPKNKVRSPSLNKRKSVAKSGPSKIDKDETKPCTNVMETKKPSRTNQYISNDQDGKTKSPSVSSEHSNSKRKDKSFEKEEVETKMQKNNKPLNKDRDKLSPASKEKMEVKGKKMKTPKTMPPPLSDKEKFDLLFEAYSKWGSDEAADKGISAYQLTRWLKNVELLEGKKVFIDMTINLWRLKTSLLHRSPMLISQ